MDWNVDVVSLHGPLKVMGIGDGVSGTCAARTTHDCEALDTRDCKCV